MSETNPRKPQRAVLRASLTFLAGYLVLVALIANYWVVPMLRTSRGGTAADQQRAVIYGTLVLILLLTLLVIGLLASFRFSAWLLRTETREQPTEYLDIWEEAGRRVTPPTAEELEGKAGPGESDKPGGPKA